MVFPSPRCLTCKGRRVKCDSTRPRCSPCRKACRSCTWESSEETGMLFKSENSFARGQPRRPRRRPWEKSPQNLVTFATLSSPIPRSVTIPVELHALNYWGQNFTTWPHDLLDIGHEYGTYSLCDLSRVKPDSSLHLALSAFSLAVFGRARHVAKALENADKVYTQSVIKTRKEIQEISNETIDQLLVATTLMASYSYMVYRAEGQFHQNFASPTKVGSGFWEYDFHTKGTAGLLLLRQKHGCAQNILLERAVRRPIIRTCILRSVTVPEWLQDGKLYGEESPMLKLDLLMIKAASLQFKSLEILCNENLVQLSRTDKMQELAIEAQELELAFEAWSWNLPEEWMFSLVTSLGGSEPTKSDLLYESSFHSYTTHGHAAVWIRYRAVRLIVNSVLMRLLSSLARRKSQAPWITSQLEISQATINSLAANICYGVPIFFNSYNTIQNQFESESIEIGDNNASAELDIEPKMAVIIAWPLTVAISTEGVPRPQKEWLQCRMKTVANVMGAAAFHCLAENEEFATSNSR